MEHDRNLQLTKMSPPKKLHQMTRSFKNMELGSTYGLILE